MPQRIDLRNDILPSDHWLKLDVYSYPQFKGVYYAYDKYSDTWNLYQDFYYGCLRMYNATKYRIDQCFDLWFKTEKLFE